MTAIACALALPGAPRAVAGGFDPLPALDLNPLTQIHGLPAFYGAHLLPAGQAQLRIDLEAASHFLMQSNGRESLVLDGETHRAGVTLSYGTTRGEWGIAIPYVTHSGGFLDGLVEEWHQAFGLPQSGRDQASRDRLAFLYRRDGDTRVRLESARRGLGDVRLFGAWPLATAQPVALALRASLKLPTGEPRHLLGSGAADLALWLAAGSGDRGRAWGWTASAGVLALGHGEVLPESQRSLALFGGAGIGWRVLPRIVLKSELRGHTPLYRATGVRALDRSALQLILGGSWRIGPRAALDLAVTEDARVETAPDVGFLLGISLRF